MYPEVQLASNRPYLKSALVFGEQVIRSVLAWLLLERLQINALIIAYFVGLLTKSIAAYLINNRVCFRQRFYFWQSLAAPILAGGVHFLIVRWVTGLIWLGDQATSVLIFLIGILISLAMAAWPSFKKFGIEFFWRVEWVIINEEFGAAIAIFGTLSSAAIAVLIAVPLSFDIALFLCLYRFA